MGTIPAELTDNLRVKFWTMRFLTFPSLLGHTHSIRWAGLSYISTKLVDSPQEINHYIKANIRTLWDQVALCRKVRTNLSNLDQFDWALETLSLPNCVMSTITNKAGRANQPTGRLVPSVVPGSARITVGYMCTGQIKVVSSNRRQEKAPLDLYIAVKFKQI